LLASLFSLRFLSELKSRSNKKAAFGELVFWCTGLLATLVILIALRSLNEKPQIFDLLASLFSLRFLSKLKSRSNKKARLWRAGILVYRITRYSRDPDKAPL